MRLPPTTEIVLFVLLSLLMVAVGCSDSTRGPCAASMDDGIEARCGSGPSPDSGDLDSRKPATGTDLDATLVDASLGDGSFPDPSSTCAGNTKQRVFFRSPACQAAIGKECCPQLTACFDLVPPAGGPSDDCNALMLCYERCVSQPREGDCQDACELRAPQGVVDALDNIFLCWQHHPTIDAACH